MENYSTIELTFTAELPLGSVVAFYGSNVGGEQYFPETYVPSRISFYQVTTATSFTGITGEQTAINYYNAMLIDSFGLGVVDVSRIGNKVIIKRLNVNYATTGIGYAFALTSTLPPYNTVTNPVSVTIVITNNAYETPLLPVDMNPLDILRMNIEIIDTYVNTSPLIVNYSLNPGPKLIWSGGDDIFQNMMTSKLTFNMLVEDGADGRFAHLFTGDEDRFLVKLNTVDLSNNVSLVWQGYLLPDEQKEPWHGGVFAVDFTAVDKLGSLKGKYLKPWMYNNRVPVGQLLAYCLEPTKLNQEIIVSPSLIPQYGSFKFKDINVPLYKYFENNKAEDVYTILNDYLTNNGLTIYNYRGFWFIVGLSRKRESVVENSFKFAADGSFIEYININRANQTYSYENQLYITTVPPFKQINVNFNLSGTNNGYSENVVVQKFYSTLFSSNKMRYSVTPYQQIYKTGYFKLWQRFGISGNYHNLTENSERFFIEVSFITAINEAIALTNYWKCPEQPFVKAGIDYEFKIEATYTIHSLDEDLNDAISDGSWDEILAYQMLIGNTEVYAHRPSSIFEEHTRSFYAWGTGAQIKFSLKTKIVFAQSGRIDFRLLLPIWTDLAGNNNYVQNFALDNLSLSSIAEESGNIYSLSAVRDIKYTKEKELDVKFLSNADETIINNYGLGAPLNLNYINSLTRLPESTFVGHHYFGSQNQVDKLITLTSFAITAAQFQELFLDGFSDNVYLVKSSGEEVAFKSWYSHTHNNVNRMGFLKNYDDGVIIPKDYKKTPNTIDSDGDFKYFLIKYPLEFSSAREYWFIDGVADGDTFLRQLVKMYHYVTHRISYSIEGTCYGLMFPNDLPIFNYYGQNRNFIPTNLELDLCAGKTTVKASEAIWDEVTDITIS